MLSAGKCQRTELEEKEEYLLGIERLALSLQGTEGVLHGDYTNLVWRKDQKTEMIMLLAAPCLWRDLGWKGRQRLTKKPSPSWHIRPQ